MDEICLWLQRNCTVCFKEEDKDDKKAGFFERDTNFNAVSGT